MLYRILSAFSLSCRLSMMASSNLDALFWEEGKVEPCLFVAISEINSGFFFVRSTAAIYVGSEAQRPGKVAEMESADLKYLTEDRPPPPTSHHQLAKTIVLAGFNKGVDTSSISLEDSELTLSSRTRSIRFLPRGLMSFRMSAMMMSIPLDSCVAMQFCRTQTTKRTEWHRVPTSESGSSLVRSLHAPGFRGRDLGSTRSDSPEFGWWGPRSSRWCRAPADPDPPWCCRRCSLRTAGSHTQGCSCSCCFGSAGSSEETQTVGVGGRLRGAGRDGGE